MSTGLQRAYPRLSSAAADVAAAMRLAFDYIYQLRDTVGNLGGSLDLAGLLRDLPAGLGSGGRGRVYRVTDYDHTLRWTGTGWEWGSPGERSGYYQMFHSAPDPLTGWQLADGSTVARLNPNGTTTNVTVDNYATSAYLKGANAHAGPAAAGGTVANESAHTHADGTLATDSVSAGTPAGTVGAIVATGYTPIVVVSTGLVNVADQQHDHPTPAFAGNPMAGHQHDVTGATAAGSAHGHAAGTLELRRGEMMLYYRR